MAKLTYMASRIKNMVSQLKSNTENKAYQNAQYMNIALRQVGQVPTLQMDTDQPSFHLLLSKPLLDEQSAQAGDIQVECQTDNQHVWRVRTVDLERALASCRQQTVTMTLGDDGLISLTTGQNSLTLQGEVLESQDAESNICQSAPLMGAAELIRGLSAALEVASLKGNDLEKSGVHLSYNPDGLLIEGANPLALAVTEYKADVWKQSHQEQGEAILTADAVRHLVHSLAAVGEEQVRLQVQDNVLLVETEQLLMEADLQPVNYFDSSEFRCRQYPMHFSVDRRALLQGLSSLRAIGETQVRLSTFASSLRLTHVDAARTTCTTCLECVPTSAQASIPERTLPIAPLMIPLALHLTQDRCTLGYHTEDCPLCISCAETKVYLSPTLP